MVNQWRVKACKSLYPGSIPGEASKKFHEHNVFGICAPLRGNLLFRKTPLFRFFPHILLSALESVRLGNYEIIQRRG
ncbi:hypothetical protein [Agrobacterium salinitolerans]|uniref:hypothetical protein n=1 Tax=Agrobacterium salinitolerans TaxID=1183413 RepID=UPI0010541809|nr:hypothetical protein [Agrobacterium salinitolerans]